MDRFERVRRLRDEYESALDEAEKLRGAYHREVVKLHRSGVSLRDIAEQLGISHQRVHQIVGTGEPRPKRRRAVGGAAAILLLAGIAAGIVGLHSSGGSGRSPSPSVAAAGLMPPPGPALGVGCIRCHVVPLREPGGSFASPLEMAKAVARIHGRARSSGSMPRAFVSG